MNLSIRALGGAAVMALAFGGLAAHADEMRLPQTSEEHEAMARAYEGKAAAWRGEAAYHREMAAAYKRSHPDPDVKGIYNDDASKMEKHCMAIVKHVEKLVAAAEVAAKHHHLRAKALQGQKGSSSLPGAPGAERGLVCDGGRAPETPLRRSVPIRAGREGRPRCDEPSQAGLTQIKGIRTHSASKSP